MNAAPLLWLLLVGVLFTPPLKAEQDLVSRLNSHNTVALVTVNYRAYLSNFALSRPGVLAIDSVVYNGVVQQSWKGEERGSAIEFLVNFDDCDVSLSLGKNYLIFATRSETNRLQVARCSDLIESEQGAELLAALNYL